MENWILWCVTTQLHDGRGGLCEPWERSLMWTPSERSQRMKNYILLAMWLTECTLSGLFPVWHYIWLWMKYEQPERRFIPLNGPFPKCRWPLNTGLVSSSLLHLCTRFLAPVEPTCLEGELQRRPLYRIVLNSRFIHSSDSRSDHQPSAWKEPPCTPNPLHMLWLPVKFAVF